jgi:hypothetical protein
LGKRANPYDFDSEAIVVSVDNLIGSICHYTILPCRRRDCT